MTTVTEVRSILGLCKVFRWFVSNFARVAALLRRRLREGPLEPFDGFAVKEIKALGPLKAKLGESLFALLRSQYPNTVDTDASDKEMGCVLLQKRSDRTDRPIGYWSYSSNYS